MGPTTKLPSLGHISFDDMAAAYTEQAVALIEGGVDVLLLETCQDILQAKAGLVGIFDALKKTGKHIPVQVQVTLEATGTMLLGTEIGAALTALEMFDVAVIGMNCATGPKEMNDARALPGREFAQARLGAAERRAAAERRRTRGLRAQPQELADYHKQFITEYGVRIVGGCCGTTPEHLKAVADTCANLEPAKRDVKPTAAAASAYSMVPLDLDPKPLIVAEEMNTTTRVEHFKNMVRSAELRRDPHAGQEAGERRLAHARPVLRHRGRGREGLHQQHPGEDRHARARAHHSWIRPRPT